MYWSEILQLAAEQNGYFTTRQAAEHGASRRALHHRAETGELEHARYGLWRLAMWPSSPNDELYALQALAPFGTFSHETALSLLELGDLIPSEIHMTIPESSRLMSRPSLRLHRSRLGAETKRLRRDGLWISTPARALKDAAHDGADPDQLRGAAKSAKERGLLSSKDIEELRTERLFGGVL
jgi:predicted transcriptional regulator of viral defense system